MMDEAKRQVDTCIVGGGLAGLAAATFLARGGRSVTVLERSSALGGRAATSERRGFRFNLGPHALYRAGEGMDVLRELGVRFSGGLPPAASGFALAGGKKHALPAGFVSLLTTGLFGLGAKLEAAKFLGAFPRLDAQELDSVTVAEYLESRIRHPEVRGLVAGLLRVATYGHCPERMSAGAAVMQLQRALRSGVLYLDGGWQTLVDGLRTAAESAGARIRTATAAVTLEHHGSGYRIGLRGGEVIEASSVVIATPLDAAAELLGDAAPGVRRFAESALPVRAACLDVGLTRLPAPRATFAVGTDRPYYLSVHTAAAKLAVEPAALIHVAKYLHPEEPNDAKAAERELEALLDLVQPGWRNLVDERRFLPSMTVASALPLASQGGLAGRPGCAIPGLPGVCLAGDWVGPSGALADASLASARTAARHLLEEPAARAAA